MAPSPAMSFWVDSAVDALVAAGGLLCGPQKNSGTSRAMTSVISSALKAVFKALRRDSWCSSPPASCSTRPPATWRAEWVGSPMPVWMVGQHLVHPVHVRRQALLAAYLQPLFLMWSALLPPQPLPSRQRLDVRSCSRSCSCPCSSPSGEAVAACWPVCVEVFDCLEVRWCSCSCSR